MEFIYEDLTRELIGCFFDVHNSLGVGDDEKAYHKALERRFLKSTFTTLPKYNPTCEHWT